MGTLASIKAAAKILAHGVMDYYKGGSTGSFPGVVSQAPSARLSTDIMVELLVGSWRGMGSNDRLLVTPRFGSCLQESNSGARLGTSHKIPHTTT